MLSVRLLGDLEILLDDVRIELPTPVDARTLTLIAVSGPGGIAASDLHAALEGTGRSRERGTLQRRVSNLRKDHGLPIPRLRGAEPYRLESDQLIVVDAGDFVAGVAALTDPDPARADRLMRLWRGNPLPGLGTSARAAWQHVVDAHDRLVEVLGGWPPAELGRLTALGDYAALFPDDWRLQRLAGGPSGKPRLLVVEDQVMDEIVLLLKDEFEIVQAVTYKQWDTLRESGVLATIQAALVDRHLDPQRMQDSLGTTKVATYLQLYTDIPVTLMSVDVDCSANKQIELCLKYRLMDVIRKHADGQINSSGLVDAARAMTDRSPRAWSARMRRWVESIAYQVQDQSLMASDSPDVATCFAERDRAISLLERGQRDQAEEAVAEFRRRWDRSAAAARP